MKNFFYANKVFFCIIGVITFLFLCYLLFFSAPANFPVGTIFQVEKGDSLRSVSLKLKDEEIIRSRLIFEALVIILGREKHVVGADYYFEKKLSVWAVANRISKGKRNMAPIVVVIPEGFNNVQIAEVFASKLVNFNKAKFLLDAKAREGYLFPDTYFFLTTDTEADVIKSMSENFEKKMLALQPEIDFFTKTKGRTEQEIIIMASLIEGEAKGDTDREFISGILWKRLSIGMPLQVDAAKETYQTKGLLKSPIGNPGGEAIKAAINPRSSSYLYYLHDQEGRIHYARTFDEHRKNILKYLQ